MLAMGFLIAFVYEFLRPIKTTLMVTAEGSSSEVILYLRMWVVLPSSMIITLIISRLSNRYKRDHVFYIIISSFLFLLFIFTVFIYPHHKIFELREFTNFLKLRSYLEHKELLIIIRHWPLSLFFVLSELWATIILSILFWGYINEITSVENSKKLYWAILLAGNSSAILAGLLGQLFSSPILNVHIPVGNNPWDKTIYATLSFAILIGICIVAVFKRLDRLVTNNNVIKESKIKIKISRVFQSRHLIYLTLIVIAYNVSYNLIEVLWTNKLHQHCPDPITFSAYISRMVSLTGALSILSTLFICRQTIQRFGWTITALITPCIWLITGIGFFMALILEDNFFYQMLAAFLDLTPIAFTVLIGATQISLGRASRYTLFDQTKEMAFIPLSTNDQRVGKIWIEGVVTWAGRLGATIIYNLFLIFYMGSNFVSCILYTFIFFVLVWIISVRILGKNLPLFA